MIEGINNITKANVLEEKDSEDSLFKSIRNKILKFAGILKQEENIDISVTFDFHKHTTIGDLKSLEEEIKKCDVFIIEDVFWTQRTLKDYTDLSLGNVTPEYMNKNYNRDATDIEKKYFDTKFKIIYNSGKVIAILEPPVGHPLRTELNELFNSRVDYDKIDSLSDLITYRKKVIKLHADLEKRREEYIISHFKDLVEEAKQQKIFKQKINFLFSYGAAHTPLYHQVKKDFKDSKYSFTKMPFIYPLHVEVTRNFTFGKEPTDLLVARDWFRAAFLSDEYNTSDSQLIDIYERKVVEKFSLEEIEELFNLMKKNDNKGIALYLEQKLKEKGIPAKETEKKMRSFINS